MVGFMVNPPYTCKLAFLISLRGLKTREFFHPKGRPLVGQKEFLKLNGLEMFVKLFNEANTEPLVIKAITLMTDILTEQIEYVTSLLRKQGQDVSGDISGRYGLCFFS